MKNKVLANLLMIFRDIFIEEMVSNQHKWGNLFFILYHHNQIISRIANAKITVVWELI